MATPKWVMPAIVIGAVLLLLNGGINFGGGETPDPGTGPCYVEDTTVTLNSFDTENRGTATGGLHSVWVNGDYFGTVVDAATMTASPGDSLEILFNGNESELDQGYYPKLVTETLDCVGTAAITEYVKDKNSTANTLSFFNSDDGLANSGGDNQEIAADGEETLELTLQGTSKNHYGDTKLVIVFDANQTAYTEVSIPGATKVGIPSQHSAVAATRAYAYEVAPVVGSSTARYDVTIEATDVEPTTGCNITVTVYDDSMYIDGDTNRPASGTEDEDYNDVGATSTIGTISIS